MTKQQAVASAADAVELVPASVAYDNRIVPLRFLADTLIVGTAEPLSTEARQRLTFILNRNVRGVIRSADWIEARLQELYDVHPESDEMHNGATWYWPHWHWWEGEQLNVKCSGWEGSIHWSGCHEFPPDHAEHDMWRWIVAERQYHRLVDEKEIPSIRRIWRRYLSRRRPKLVSRESRPDVV